MLNMNTMLGTRLFSVIDTESPASTDYQIAKFILENIQTLEVPTTESLAEQCNTSKASVSRFCKKIGLNDFFELRSLIYNFKLPIHHKMDLPFHVSLPQIREDFINDIIAKLTAMRDCLEHRKIDELIRDLKTDRKITIMGHMQSGTTARNLQYNLFTCNKIVGALTSHTSQTKFFRQASSEDGFPSGGGRVRQGARRDL